MKEALFIPGDFLHAGATFFKDPKMRGPNLGADDYQNSA
jgi:hypothetical protein